MIKWSPEAVKDISRLHTFSSEANPLAAAQAVQKLTAVPEVLLTNPRIGEKLFEFEPKEVRRLLVGQYEIRYQVERNSIFIARIWHTRETR